MARLPPRRRAAVLASSLAVVVTAAVVFMRQGRSGGPAADASDFALGLVVGAAIAVALVLIVKSQSGRRPGG
jgi:hypothetical protein